MEMARVDGSKTIPKNAVQIHMYNVKDILRPRGPLQKESLSAYIKDRIESGFESWTNPSYGDSVDEVEMLQILRDNLMEEVNIAFESFIGEIAERDPELIWKLNERK